MAHELHAHALLHPRKCPLCAADIGGSGGHDRGVLQAILGSPRSPQETQSRQMIGGCLQEMPESRANTQHATDSKHVKLGNDSIVGPAAFFRRISKSCATVDRFCPAQRHRGTGQPTRSQCADSVQLAN